VVVSAIHDVGKSHLAVVLCRSSFLSSSLCLGKDGEQNRRENCDDCNNNQQFDKRKCFSLHIKESTSSRLRVLRDSVSLEDHRDKDIDKIAISKAIITCKSIVQC